MITSDIYGVNVELIKFLIAMLNFFARKNHKKTDSDYRADIHQTTPFCSEDRPFSTE